jgi:protein-S-isoprenylcysteine O-methyltransferase Ste14
VSELTTYLLAYALLLTYGLIILRVVVRREYQRRGNLSVLTATLQGLLFFLYGGFPYFYLEGDWPAVDVNLVVHVIGLTLLFGGLAILFYGMFRLGILRSLGRGGKALEISGIYRWTRNPQALACGLYVIGFAVLWPSWYALGWAALYFILIHTMILTEEEHLLHIHDQEYEDYFREVPRYLGHWFEGEQGISSDESSS